MKWRVQRGGLWLSLNLRQEELVAPDEVISLCTVLLQACQKQKNNKENPADIIAEHVFFFFFHTQFSNSKSALISGWPVMAGVFREKSGHKDSYIKCMTEQNFFMREIFLSFFFLSFFPPHISTYNPLYIILIWILESSFLTNTFSYNEPWWLQLLIVFLSKLLSVFLFLPPSHEHFKTLESQTRMLVLNEYI